MQAGKREKRKYDNKENINYREMRGSMGSSRQEATHSSLAVKK